MVLTGWWGWDAWLLGLWRLARLLLCLIREMAVFVVEKKSLKEIDPCFIRNETWL